MALPGQNKNALKHRSRPKNASQKRATSWFAGSYGLRPGCIILSILAEGQACIEGSLSPNTSGGKLLNIIIGSPSLSHSLPLGEEIEPSFAIKVQVSTNGLLVTGEREHWQRDRNWHIDADLATCDLLGELP